MVELVKPTKRVKAKKPKPVDYQKKADAVLQELNRKTFEYCEVCGGENQVGHHFIKKSQSIGLRYDMSNIISLCNRCHCSIHQGKSDMVTGKIVAVRGIKWLYELETKAKELRGLNYSKHWYQSQYESIKNAL